MGAYCLKKEILNIREVALSTHAQVFQILFNRHCGGNLGKLTVDTCPTDVHICLIHLTFCLLLGWPQADTIISVVPSRCSHLVMQAFNYIDYIDLI